MTGPTGRKPLRQQVDEATTPIYVNEALTKLCKNHNPRLVMAAVEAWLDYMQSVTDDLHNVGSSEPDPDS